MVDKVVVVLAVVEGVKDQAIEEGSLVLGLSNNEWNFGESTLDEHVLRRVRQDLSIDGGGEPTGEGEEHLEDEKIFLDVAFLEAHLLFCAIQ